MHLIKTRLTQNISNTRHGSLSSLIISLFLFLSFRVHRVESYPVSQTQLFSRSKGMRRSSACVTFGKKATCKLISPFITPDIEAVIALVRERASYHGIRCSRTFHSTRCTGMYTRYQICLWLFSRLKRVT